MNNRNTQSDSDQKDSFCSTCGEQINFNTKHCPNCGTELLMDGDKSTKELKQGQSLTRIILTSSFAIILISNVLELIISNKQCSSNALIILILVVILYTLFYRGYSFARFIAIAILGLSGLYGIIAGILIMSKSWLALLPIGVGILYVFFAVILFRVKSIKLFQEYQRKNRKMIKKSTTIWIVIIYIALITMQN